MSRRTSAVMEWLRPSSVHRDYIPPLEAGLRPNSDLDAAAVLSTQIDEPDDLVVAESDLIVSSDARILRLEPQSEWQVLAKLPGQVDALTMQGRKIIAAVRNLGLAAIDLQGRWSLVDDSPLVRNCVTAIAASGQNELIVTVGSSERSSDAWSTALVLRDRSGRVLRTSSTGTEVIADGLAWPSGVAVVGDDYLLSLSHTHAVERRQLSDPSCVESLLSNMAGYPGRIAVLADGGFWLAVPYLRNRATELILSEPDALDDMVSTIAPELWLVPQLRTANVHRSPLQVGQQRVMGVIKPWAPPRSYGLVVRYDAEGRALKSLHSRPDGDVHGITAIRPHGDSVIAVSRGAGRVVSWEQPDSSTSVMERI